LTVRADGQVVLGETSYELRPLRERVRAGRTVVRLKPLDPDDGERIVRSLERGATARAKLDVRLADVLANKLRFPLVVTLTAGGERMVRGA
jgi:hypothetical protein